MASMKHDGATSRALTGATLAPFSAGRYPPPRLFTMRALTYSVCTDRMCTYRTAPAAGSRRRPRSLDLPWRFYLS
jgi:hypothetical protein